MRYYINREEKVVIADNSQLENNLTDCGYEEINSIQYDMIKKEYEKDVERGNYLWQTNS